MAASAPQLPTETCQVRVGVRVRPLTSKESSEGGKVIIDASMRVDAAGGGGGDEE